MLLEASIVGLVMMCLGLLIAVILKKVYGYLDLKVDLPESCSKYNKYRIMEATLFATGFIGHLLFEAIGANKYYTDYKHKELYPQMNWVVRLSI